jgi:hypothetical protein
MELSNRTKAPDYLNLTTSLAMELAQGLSPPKEVFARNEITEADAITLLKSPDFQAMVKAAKNEWAGVGNIPERIRLKAQMALEELMLPQFQMARDPRTPATARNDAFKSFERLAGTQNADMDVAAGPKFVLNINLGPKTKEFSGVEIEGTAEEKVLEPAA